MKALFLSAVCSIFILMVSSGCAGINQLQSNLETLKKATTTAATAETLPSTAIASYTDPFAYCAAVGTIDIPDARYTGNTIPDAIIQGMIEQQIVSADAPLAFQQHAVWRCMNTQVWVCHFGANLPCLEKADISETPPPALADFCQANPGAESTPAVVTGRATVYQWGCQAEKPVVIKQIFEPDAQGYLAEFWYELR